MAAALLDFYRYSCYRGENSGPTFVHWENNDTADLVVTPLPQKHVYITEINFLATDDFALNGGDTVDINPWGYSAPPTVSIATLRQLYAYAGAIGGNAPILNAGSDNMHWIRYYLRPFVKVTGADTFSVVNSGGATQTMTGTLDIAVFSFYVDQADL